MFIRLRRPRWRLPGAVGALGIALPMILGSHWSGINWQDMHVNYPDRPSGYSQIVGTFGQPCSNAAQAITRKWIAYDNKQIYNVVFHRKLGGMATNLLNDQGGRSTNLDNDVWGHINVRHLNRYVKSGIWGYACRVIAGTSSWSTHAWGIAVDVSAAFEPYGHCGSYVNYQHADWWKKHNWHWGRTFCDSMHFQYAIKY